MFIYLFVFVQVSLAVQCVSGVLAALSSETFSLFYLLP